MDGRPVADPLVAEYEKELALGNVNTVAWASLAEISSAAAPAIATSCFLNILPPLVNYISFGFEHSADADKPQLPLLAISSC